MQSLGKNKSGSRAENIKLVCTEEKFKKSPHLFTLLFYTTVIMRCYAKQC